MRVRLIFATENRGALVPFHHQHLIADLFESYIRDMSVQPLAGLYNFSGLKGQTKVTPNGLQYFSSKVTIVFSGESAEFVTEFIKLLFSKERIKVGELYIIPESVEKEQAVLAPDSNKYLCISPMVIGNPKNPDVDAKKFVSPLSDQFSDILYESTMTRMESSGRFTAEEITSFYKFQIVPDKDYLAKIKEGDKKFARIYTAYDSETAYEIRGYTFPFTLYAHQKVHEFVFINGIGIFTNKGFGMLDIANQGIKKHTVQYEVQEA